jgi:hypothetical protein
MDQREASYAPHKQAARDLNYRNIMSDLCDATHYCSAKLHMQAKKCAHTSWNERAHDFHVHMIPKSADQKPKLLSY